MKHLSKAEVNEIKTLRSRGLSISEISAISRRGKATVSRYIKGVEVVGESAQILREKQGGSRIRAEKAWETARVKAKKLIDSPLTKRERLIALSALYWAEGTKRELGFINSDGLMIKMFVSYLEDLGVKKKTCKLHLGFLKMLMLIKLQYIGLVYLAFKSAIYKT